MKSLKSIKKNIYPLLDIKMEQLTEEELGAVLKVSSSNKAESLDEIRYESWKGKKSWWYIFFTYATLLINKTQKIN